MMRSSTHKKGMSLFKFPTNKTQRMKWVRAVQTTRAKCPHSCICSEHFTKDIFKDTSLLARQLGITWKMDLPSHPYFQNHCQIQHQWLLVVVVGVHLLTESSRQPNNFMGSDVQVQVKTRADRRKSIQVKPVTCDVANQCDIISVAQTHDVQIQCDVSFISQKHYTLLDSDVSSVLDKSFESDKSYTMKIDDCSGICPDKNTCTLKEKNT